MAENVKVMNKNRRRGKDFERFIAADLGGRRTGILGHEDVIIPLCNTECLAECKERKKLPKFITDCLSQAKRNCPDDKLSAIFLHELNQSHVNDIVIMKYSDWKRIYDFITFGLSCSKSWKRRKNETIKI